MLFQKFKNNGFNSIELKIILPKTKYSQEEQLHGEVHLLGGKLDQKINAIHLSFIREWKLEFYAVGTDIDFLPGGSHPYSTARVSMQAEYELQENSGQDEIWKIELATDITIHAEQKVIYPFEAKLPKVRIEEGRKEKWRLQAKADIPYGDDVVTQQKIKIVVPSKTDKQ